MGGVVGKGDGRSVGHGTKTGVGCGSHTHGVGPAVDDVRVRGRAGTAVSRIAVEAVNLVSARPVVMGGGAGGLRAASEDGGGPDTLGDAAPLAAGEGCRVVLNA